MKGEAQRATPGQLGGLPQMARIAGHSARSLWHSRKSEYLVKTEKTRGGR